MAEIVYGQMLASRELPQQIPPQAKARMQNPRVGPDFWCKSPGVRGGWMVMAKTDSCIISLTQHELKFN